MAATGTESGSKGSFKTSLARKPEILSLQGDCSPCRYRAHSILGPDLMFRRLGN